MQMVSDVPIGAFLSRRHRFERRRRVHGARTAPRPVKTYAIGFEGERGRDVLQRAALCAAGRASCSAPIITRSSSTRTSSSLLPQLLWHMDEPIADTAFITTYLVSEFARRDVTVILSGVGGDELFGGYRRYLGEHYAGAIRPAAERGCAAARRRARRTAAERPSFAAAQRDAPRQRLSVAARACRSRSATAAYVQVFDATQPRALLRDAPRGASTTARARRSRSATSTTS